MLIQALNNLYPILLNDPEYQVEQTGGKSRSVIWEVVLKPSGEISEILSLKDGTKGKTMITPLIPGTPESGSGIATQPGYSRNVQDAFGIRKIEEGKLSDGIRQRKAFQQWMELHEIPKTKSHTLQTFKNFLKMWNSLLTEDSSHLAEEKLLEILQIQKIEDFAQGGAIIFRIEGEKEYIHQDKNWVQEILNTGQKQASGKMIFCPILKKEAEIAILHPKIKLNEALISSINKTNFESYGNNGGEIAGISQEAADNYGAALNALITHPQNKHRQFLGGLQWIFWTSPNIREKTPLSEIFGEEEGEREDPQKLQDTEGTLNLNSQGKTGDKSQTKIHLLCVLPQKGRLPIKFYEEIFLSEFEKNVKSHQDDCTPPGFKLKYQVGIWKMIQIKKSKGKDDRPDKKEDARAMLDSILKQKKYPQGLCFRTINRVSMLTKNPDPKTKPFPLICLLSGWLTRNHNQNKTEIMTSPAYKLGKALQIMKMCQTKIGERNKDIAQRFAGTLSQQPNKNFGKLNLLNQTHLKKLKKLGKGGYSVWAEKLIDEALSGIETLPDKFSRKEQAEFWLGFHSQITTAQEANGDEESNPEETK